nr:hypothetical protein [Candidatus Njordarchaeum guaymaensis]
MSKKDELLQELDFSVLIELAKSVSESPIKSNATRSDLLKIVKESLSVEEIKRKVKDIDVGRPSGELTRGELRVGGVGQVFLAISGMMSPIGYFVAYGLGGTADYRGLAPSGLISSIMFLVFAILLRVSIARITWKLGGSGSGTAASLFALIAAITGLVYYILTILGVTTVEYFMGYYTLNALGVMLMLSYILLTGIAITLLGVFFLLYREYSPNSELWMAGGIIYIIAGASYLGLTSSLYISATPFVAGIIGATCFLARRAPK